MLISLGSTFWGQAPNSKKPHLYVVISCPTLNDGKVAIVNITSYYPGCGNTECFIRVGDHPDIVHDSVVRFDDGNDPLVSTIEDGIKRGLLTPSDPMSEATLNRIIEAARVSKSIPKKCQALLSPIV